MLVKEGTYGAIREVRDFVLTKQDNLDIMDAINILSREKTG